MSGVRTGVFAGKPAPTVMCDVACKGVTLQVCVGAGLSAMGQALILQTLHEPAPNAGQFQGDSNKNPEKRSVPGTGLPPPLAEHFTVVTADLRGFGDSGRPPTNSTAIIQNLQ